jgi:hypothetical protein
MSKKKLGTNGEEHNEGTERTNKKMTTILMPKQLFNGDFYAISTLLM